MSMKEHVVAIDLGTSCTAYSTKSLADPNPSVGVPDMQRNEAVVGKSPTTLLINGQIGGDKMFHASGVEAYGRVAHRLYAENDIPHGSQLFKRFKMQLHKNPKRQNFDDLQSALTKSASGRAEMRLLDIFVMALQYIMQAALQKLQVSRRIEPYEVLWVLTVPVCCSEPAKHFMRQAARQAGFISGGADDESLVLCMEPIAACLALGNRLTWAMGDKYLVIDCGGGTVDISAFRVIDPATSSLEQLGKAVGGSWGSTNVDRQFDSYIKDYIYSVAQDASGPSLEHFFASSAMYRISQSWEQAKCGLRSVDRDCRIDLSELREPPLEVRMEDMDRGRSIKNMGGEEVVGGHGTWDLVLRPALLREFFRPQCDNIAQAVSELLHEPHLQGLTSVVMVGGFSGSVHVQEAVKGCVLGKYPDGSVTLALAANPDLAIVQGAAHCVALQQLPAPDFQGRQYPAAPQFASMVSANSYGVVVAEENSHNKTPTIFDPFFLRGEGYSMNATVEKAYMVTSGEPFIMSIGSCPSPRVQPGRNYLQNIGGLGAVQTKDYSVGTPVPPAGCGCFGGSRPLTKINIFVQFTLIGIELHVRVRLQEGTLLLQETVPFVGS